MTYGFGDLESRFASVAVKAANPELQISGRLSLAGQDTLADLEANCWLGQEKTEEGWFDLTIQGNQDRKFLLQNALMIQSGESPFGRGHWRHQIFPNRVIVDAQHLAEDNKVREIGFELDHLNYFFWYERFESHRLGETVDGFHDYLRMLRIDASKRYDFSRAADDYDFTNADEIHVIHHAPPPMEFQIDSTRYSVYIGLSSGGGNFKSINYEQRPFLSIEFPEPIAISDALTALYTWRRFFNQIAYADLDLLGVSARGLPNKMAQTSQIYLPNERRAMPSASDKRAFHPINVPLSSWSERDALRSLMMQWLSAEPTRQRFRIFLDRAIALQQSENSLEQIAMLCAGIDSLSVEKLGSKKIEKATMSAMASAAHATSPDIPLSRIKTVLGSLNSTPLRSKIEGVAFRAAPTIPEAQIKQLSSHAKRLRNIAAHGAPKEPLRQPLLAPVCQALTSLCILHDLELSGLNTRQLGGNTQLLAHQKLNWALNALPKIDDS